MASYQIVEGGRPMLKIVFVMLVLIGIQLYGVGKELDLIPVLSIVYDDRLKIAQEKVFELDRGILEGKTLHMLVGKEGEVVYLITESETEHRLWKIRIGESSIEEKSVIIKPPGSRISYPAEGWAIDESGDLYVSTPNGLIVYNGDLKVKKVLKTLIKTMAAGEEGEIYDVEERSHNERKTISLVKYDTNRGEKKVIFSYTVDAHIAYAKVKLAQSNKGKIYMYVEEFETPPNYPFSFPEKVYLLVVDERTVDAKKIYESSNPDYMHVFEDFAVADDGSIYACVKNSPSYYYIIRYSNDLEEYNVKEFSVPIDRKNAHINPAFMEPVEIAVKDMDNERLVFVFDSLYSRIIVYKEKR